MLSLKIRRKIKYAYKKGWEELRKIPNESKTHRLEVDVEGCCGWLISKDPKPYKKN